MFFPAMERTKDRRGPPSVSTYAQRVLTGGLSPDPYFTGDAFLRVGQSRPAGKISVAYSSCRRATGPCVCKIWWTSALESHRLPWHSKGSWAIVGGRMGTSAPTHKISSLFVGAGVLTGPPDHACTKQVGRHQAVCVRRIFLQTLMEPGPSGPGIERTSHSNFARRGHA